MKNWFNYKLALFKVSVVCFSVLFYAGCVTAPAKNETKKATSDHTHSSLIVPNDTQAFYYAMGEGKSLKEARNAALAEISEKISVSVESSLKSTVSVKSFNQQEDVYRKVQKDIQTKTKKIQFTGVKIIDKVQMPSSVKVVVKVDRARLFQTYREKISAIKEKLNTAMALFDRSSPFEKLKQSVAIQKMMNEMAEDISLLQAMNPNYKPVKDVEFLSSLNNKLVEAKRKLVFRLVPDKNSKQLASIIESRLTEQNIRVVKEGGNVLLMIKTTGKPTKIVSTNPRLANMKAVARITSFLVKDNQGRVVSNVQVKTKGLSYDSYEEAMLQTKPYIKIIDKYGVLNLITGHRN